LDEQKVFALYHQGRSDKEIAKALRCSRTAVSLWRQRNHLPSNYDPDQSDSSICFDCANAVGGCSWSRRDEATGEIKFEPVPGWTAQEVCRYDDNRKQYTKSWRITACPLFVPDEGEDKED